MTTTKKNSPVEGLESESCPRCGGTGHYSYCQAYGTTCFGCRGTGWRYTKRGAAANEYLSQLRSKKWADVKPGDQVWYSSITLGGSVYWAWFKILVIEPLTEENSGYRIHNKETGEYEVPKGLLKIEMQFGKTDLGKLSTSASPDDLIRVRMTDAAEAERTRLMAVEYQVTLTKQGKPRKVKG